MSGAIATWVSVAVVGVASGTAVGSYALWHNDYDVWLLSSLGRMMSYIVFPGESDLYDVASAHRPGKNVDSTFHAPCILCSKTRTQAPGPSDTTEWLAPPPNPRNAKCWDIDDPRWYDVYNGHRWLKGFMEYSGAGWVSRRIAYDLLDCDKNRPVALGEVVYNSELTPDCFAVRGVGGMPRGIGMKASDYIRSRIFPSASSLKTIKMSDINTALFPKQPYLAYHSRSVLQSDNNREITSPENNNNVQYTIPGYYDAVKEIISRETPRPFMPPLLNHTNWVPVNSTSKSKDGGYYCASQMTLSTGSYFTDPKDPAPFNPIDGNFDARKETLEQYLDRIGFTAYQTFNWNGKRYYTFEFIPEYDDAQDYRGEEEFPPMRPATQWTEAQCRLYTALFLKTRTFKYMSTSGTKPMSKMLLRNGFWQV